MGFYAYRKRKQQDVLSTIKSSSPSEISDVSSPKPIIENISIEPTGVIQYFYCIVYIKNVFSIAPVITIEDKEVTTSINQPTTIYIKVEGFPLPEVQWFKEDEPAQHPILSDGSLYILYTTLTDGGCYTVKASNSVNSVTKQITVNVLDPVLLNG